MVPLLLRYLSAADYTLWLLYSAICGATAQVQTAVMSVSTKDIAFAFHHGTSDDLRNALHRSRRAYAILAAVVAGPVLLTAAGYFRVTQHAAGVELTAWAALAGSYSLVYLFAPNNAILLATERVGEYSNINTITRLLQFGGTIVFLTFGFSILAPCLALAAASLVSISANSICAKRRILAHTPKPIQALNGIVRGSIGRFGLYVFTSFMIYNGAFLIAAPLFPMEAASYGFALQASALLSAIALVPLQLGLSKLIRSSGTGERQELKRTLVVCNALFALGYLSVAWIAPPVLTLIGASIALPTIGILMLMYVAFSIELNISILANHLTAKGNYSFARWYAFIAFTSLAIGTFVAWTSGLLWLGFLVIPATIQASLNLSRIVRVTMAHLHATA